MPRCTKCDGTDGQLITPNLRDYAHRTDEQCIRSMATRLKKSIGVPVDPTAPKEPVSDEPWSPGLRCRVCGAYGGGYCPECRY